MYGSMSSDKCIQLCDHHPNQNIEHFLYPQTFPLAPL